MASSNGHPPNREGRERRSKPNNAKGGHTVIHNVPASFYFLFRHIVGLLCLPLLLPFGKLPLSFLALKIGQNVRQEAACNRLDLRLVRTRRSALRLRFGKSLLPAPDRPAAPPNGTTCSRPSRRCSAGRHTVRRRPITGSCHYRSYSRLSESGRWPACVVRASCGAGSRPLVVLSLVT